MTTTPEKPRKTEVVSLTAVTNPESLAPWPTQQKVQNLADWLDLDYPKYQAMLKSLEQLERANDFTRKRIVQEAEKVIEKFEKRGGPNSVKDGRLLKRWEACCPKGWWPEDCDASPARSEVAKMIMFLMGSFPTEKIPQPKVFVKVLLDDIMALNPDFVEMESTCRELRKTKKFMPSISEVVEELEKQKKLWSNRYDVVENLEDYYNELRGAIDCAKVAEQAIADRKAAIEHRKAIPALSPDTVEAQNDYDDEF